MTQLAEQIEYIMDYYQLVHVCEAVIHFVMWCIFLLIKT